jgi:hypothetical protein
MSQWHSPVDMFVTDLHHFLNLPEDAPGPARRLGQHLGNIVRAATAGAAGSPWITALPCRRRPARRPCPGRMTVVLSEPTAPIRWWCSACDDEGVISNWADSPFDLRRRRLSVIGAVNEIILSNETAAALRALQLLDRDCARLVFGIRDHRDGAALMATDDELDELIGFVAAEANHEPNRRRQQRLDVFVAVLTDAAHTADTD